MREGYLAGGLRARHLSVNSGHETNAVSPHTPPFFEVWQVLPMLCFRPQERTLPDALALGASTLDLAAERNMPVLAAHVVHGRAVVLGATQRAGRVVDLSACARTDAAVLRRVTTGTAAWIDGPALVMSLALPHVAALHEDATNRTLLNRNVRPFLRALTHAGAMAHYFGREWISLRKRPAALLGFDLTRSGAVLIEVFLGGAHSIALPKDLQTTDEQAVDRFMGKTPAGLGEIIPDVRLEVFLERFVEKFAGPAVDFVADVSPPETPSGMLVTDVMDPWPGDYEPRALMPVPIGYLELGGRSSTRLLGGDALAPRWLYEDIGAGAARDKLGDVPVEGATLDDMLRMVAADS